MKSVFEMNELHLKFIYKLKGCSPNTCRMGSYTTVILSESVLRENFRYSTKALGMPIRYEESSRSDLTYNYLRLG
jgi:hypothetical protein